MRPTIFQAIKKMLDKNVFATLLFELFNLLCLLRKQFRTYVHRLEEQHSNFSIPIYVLPHLVLLPENVGHGPHRLLRPPEEVRRLPLSLRRGEVVPGGEEELGVQRARGEGGGNAAPGSVVGVPGLDSFFKN